MSFFEELKRRNVVRVGIAYLIVSWVLLQVVDVVAPILELPNWISRAILLLLAVGFVVAVILAWAYELTPQGIQRDEDLRSGEPGGISARRGTGFYVVAGAVALIISAGLFWYSGTDARWARNQALPKIGSHIESGDWESAYQLALQVDAIIPGDQSMASQWDFFSYSTTIPSEPAGARVSRRPYGDPNAEWQMLGLTPLVNVHLPYGFSVLKIELDNHESLQRVVGTLIPRYPVIPVQDRSMPNFAFVMPETFRLIPIGTIPDGFTWVSGMDIEIQDIPVSFADYYIAKNEVTNGEFKKFVDADGYKRPELWQNDIVIDGEVVSWADAMATFTDRTGRPGPGTWEAGTFPDGEVDFPVAGVSWYEAAAFARFAGRELPTVHHWRKAFSMALLSEMLPASNLQSASAMPVGKSDGISFTGVYDMVGNVREWAFNEVGDQRAILGGGWNDAHYIAQESISDPGRVPPADRSATNGFRLAFTLDDPETVAVAQAPVTTEEIRPDLTPVSDEVFQIYRSAFDYDAGRLDSVVESTEDFGDWRRETVTFRSAYSDERITILIEIPNNGADIYQPIIYWPGTGALVLGSTDLVNHRLEFMLKNGRAVVMPIYAGTFNRRKPDFPDWSTIAGRDLAIEQVKDLRRTIDYLETRPDIDRKNIGYYGTSWGGRVGAMVLGVEPRVKVGVLDQAGYNFNVREEIRAVHYLPRIAQPVLQFNGRYDSDFQYELHSKPFFELIGTNPVDKKWVVEDTGHFVTRATVIGETLDWFDKYLDPPQ